MPAAVTRELGRGRRKPRNYRAYSGRHADEHQWRCSMCRQAIPEAERGAGPGNAAGINQMCGACEQQLAATFERVARTVCKAHGITRSQLCADNRARRYSQARAAVVRRMREQHDAPWNRIAALLGRSRASVIQAYRMAVRADL